MKRIILILLICMLSLGCSQQKAIRPEIENIILIVVDTLRANHLGCYGYDRNTSPAVDAFAERCIVFNEAYTVQSVTGPSFTSLFTGNHTITHGIYQNGLEWPEGTHSLISDFSNAGFRTQAFAAAPVIAPDKGYGTGFDSYLAPETGWWIAPRILDNAKRMLTDNSLTLVHFFEPHSPYAPPPESLRELGIPVSFDGVFDGTPQQMLAYNSRDLKLDADDLQRVCDLYDAEILGLDKFLADFFLHLETDGYMENSVIVFTADHGEGLGENHYISHGMDYEEQLHIPLMFHFPGDWGGGTRIDGLVQNTDIIPTLMEIVGIEIPQDIDGFSFLNRIDDPTLPGREFLLSFGTPNPDAQEFSIWDGKWRRSIDFAFEIEKREIPEDEIEMLRSLGYIQ